MQHLFEKTQVFVNAVVIMENRVLLTETSNCSGGLSRHGLPCVRIEPGEHVTPESIQAEVPVYLVAILEAVEESLGITPSILFTTLLLTTFRFEPNSLLCTFLIEVEKLAERRIVRGSTSTMWFLCSDDLSGQLTAEETQHFLLGLSELGFWRTSKKNLEPIPHQPMSPGE